MVSLTQDLLNAITQTLVAALQPERIYLFGSHAYGSPTTDSDLDLMIVVNADRTHARALRRRARSLIGEIGCGVDILMRTVTDFEHRASWPSNLEAMIKSKGRLLYG